MRPSKIFLAFGVVLVGCAALRAVEKTAVPFRSITYAEAAKAAAAEHKLVLIDFYTTWCGPCKMLDAQTWTDAAVGHKVGAAAVPLRMDAEKEGSDLAGKYAIRAYPTVLLLKPDGTEVDRLVGFRPPAEFLSEFNVSLTGKNSLMRAREAAQAAVEADLEQQVKARQRLAQELMMSGKYDQALPEYLWLYDTGMKQAPAYAGVRLSFLTSEMGRMAKRYAPAKEALQKRRDEAKTHMDDASDPIAAQEYAALCDALGDTEALLATFDHLPAGDRRRSALGGHVFRQLVEARRYKDALDAAPYETMLRALESGFRSPPNAPEQVKEQLRQYAAKTAAVDVEVLAGAGEFADARAMRDRLLGMDATSETRQLLRDRLVRAGHAELIDEVK